MNRGDTNNFTFKLYKLDTTPKEYIDGSTYTEVEVQFNPQSTYSSVKKLKSNEEVTWDSTNSCFIVALSQSDTFKLPEGEVEVQVRLFKNDTCKGSAIYTMDIDKCLSSEVLDD